MPTTAGEIRAAVGQRFAQVARSPDQEQKFPVGLSVLGQEDRQQERGVFDALDGVRLPRGQVQQLPGLRVCVFPKAV